jgi:NADH:ubiquinone oxidoreductase subunit E
MAKKKLAKKVRAGREALLGVMESEQRKSGYLSEEVFEGIARSMKLPLGEVYGVGTFYSFLSTAPLGRHVIRVCKSVPCCLQEAEMIIGCIGEELGIGPGETTADGRFSFELTNCIGVCDEGPAMLVDDEVHGHLTPQKVVEILRSYD